MFSKIISGIICIAVASVIGSEMFFAYSSDNQEEATNIETISEKTNEMAIKAYEIKISEYKKALEDNDFNMDNYDNLASRVLMYYHIYNNFNFYYAYFDVDKNGVDELLIGIKPNDSDEYKLVDLYVFNGNTAIRAIDNNTFGDRSILTILSDGTISEFTTGGADLNITTYYKIAADGYTLSEISKTDGTEITNFDWNKIIVNSNQEEAQIIENIEFDFSGIYADFIGTQLVIKKRGDSYKGIWSNKYYTKDVLLNIIDERTLQGAIYGRDEIITIQQKDDTADLIIVGNEAYKNVKKYISYTGEFVKTGSINNDALDITDFLGNYCCHTDVGDIYLNLYLSGNVLVLESGDDVVVGYSLIVFDSYDIKDNILTAYKSGMSWDYTFIKNSENSIIYNGGPDNDINGTFYL